jgi:hypothetical protein
MSENKTIVNVVTGEIISGAITNYPFSTTEQYAEIVKCRDGIYRYIDEVSESDRWNWEEAKNLDKIAEIYASGIDIAILNEGLGCQQMELERAYKAGYRAKAQEERLRLADLHSHGSEVQEIAAAWVKQRGSTYPLAFIEESAFINGYLIAKKEK